MQEGLDHLWGPLQPKPFYDPLLHLCSETLPSDAACPSAVVFPFEILGNFAWVRPCTTWLTEAKAVCRYKIQTSPEMSVLRHFALTCCGLGHLQHFFSLLSLLQAIMKLSKWNNELGLDMVKMLLKWENIQTYCLGHGNLPASFIVKKYQKSLIASISGSISDFSGTHLLWSIAKSIRDKKNQRTYIIWSFHPDREKIFEIGLPAEATKIEL